MAEADHRSGRTLTAKNLSVLCLVALVTLLGAACGDEEPAEATIEERLSAVAGKELSAIEVEEQLAVGATLCRMDEPVLNEIWLRLNEEQLEFQDIVFSYVCPERSVFYAGQTGRFVTEEAETSGVVTSTTRPTSTVPVSPSPTSAGATIGPATSSAVGETDDSSQTPTESSTETSTESSTEASTESSVVSSTAAPTTSTPATASTPASPATPSTTQEGESG